MSIETIGLSHDIRGSFLTSYPAAEESIASSLEGPLEGSKLGVHAYRSQAKGIDGYNIAIPTQPNISGVRLLVFDRTNLEEPSKVIYLTQMEDTGPGNEYIGPVFGGFTDDLKEGDVYKLSVTYENPEYYNDNLIDDRARAFLLGEPFPDDKPNPYSVVLDSRGRLDDPKDFKRDPRLVIYEAHMKGSTELQEDIPEGDRGTYRAYTHPEVLDGLNNLGITAIEFLPLQFALPEPFIYRRQLPENKGGTNYWNYSPAGYFALNPNFSSEKDDPVKQQLEFKEAVRSLHSRGISVIVDVVYNHTAEVDSGVKSPVYSKKGLQNNRSYRHKEPGEYDDYSGCGNTLDLNDPLMLQEVIDSLRYQVTEYGVDGFRFDLGTALIRDESGNPDPEHPFFKALLSDPILKNCILTFEPWDIRGMSEGYFAGASNKETSLKEWGRDYRNGIKRVMNGYGDGISTLSDLLVGDGTLKELSYINSHDGFTVADSVAYENKHNLPNGENNRDGTNENYSRNYGHEGWDLSELPPEIQEAIIDERYRVMANMLGALAMTAGSIMMVAGDESGNSQNGNNNPFCQDNETTWIQRQNLSERNSNLKRFVQQLMAIRHTSGLGYRTMNRGPIMFSETTEQTGSNSPIGEEGVSWISQSGRPMGIADWHANKVMGMYVSGFAGEGADDASVLLYYNHTNEDQVATLPTSDTNIATAGNYEVLASTYNQKADVNGIGAIHGQVLLKADSMVILRRTSSTAPEVKVNLAEQNLSKIRELLGSIPMNLIKLTTPQSELDVTMKPKPEVDTTLPQAA